MPKFMKKPVVIEAVQWTGDNINEIFELTRAHSVGEDFLSSELTIPTLEGDMIARKGDYIIRGIKGEIYPCKPDIFEETYELVCDATKVNAC
jgi:hypothetical protein